MQTMMSNGVQKGKPDFWDRAFRCSFFWLSDYGVQKEFSYEVLS